MADDKTTKTPEQPVTDSGPGKETPPAPPKEPEKVSVSPEPEKKTEPEVKNPQVSVYNFAEIMKEKKVEERAAAPSGEKPVPAKTEKPEKQPEAPKKAEEKPKEPEQPKRRGRPPKADKDKDAAPKPKAPAQKPEKAVKKEPEKKTAPTVQTAPTPKEPEKPKDAPRRGKEQIVYIKLNELYAFKNHPFEVRDDEEMRAMVSSVKDKGVTQPAIVRPREDGGYEIVSGHRRQKASELAGYADMPCIVRNLTDDEAITQMVEDNLNQREEILPSERAKALKMQLEAIKHQGSRTSGQIDPKDAGKRSNEIVAERNKMAVKQVQRYIRLNELVPDLMKLMDEKKLGFTTAVELSYIGKKNQNYIAVAIDSQQSSPSQAQAKRMRELDEKKLLNGDVIDGIMMEDKKEVDKVILTGAELSKYFGKETTPREMKDQIMFLCRFAGGVPPFLAVWGGQTKREAPLADFKLHAARFRVCVCLLADRRVAAAVSKQPFLQGGVVSADMDKRVFLVKPNIGGLFLLRKPCSHKLSFLRPCYAIGAFFGCFSRLLT